MIEHSEHMNYHKVMKELDNRMAKLSTKQLEVEHEIAILAGIKEMIHRIWLEDHPDNRG